MSATVEHIVGRNVEQARADPAGLLGDDSRCDTVGRHRFAGRGLGTVDVSEGRAVHDDIRLGVSYRAGHGVPDANVDIVQVERHDGAPPRHGSLKLEADLTRRAEDQRAYAHSNQTREPSTGAAASAAETIGATPAGIGHSMPISRSFHRMQQFEPPSYGVVHLYVTSADSLSTRNPCANPSGIQSWRPSPAPRVTPTQHP